MSAKDLNYKYKRAKNKVEKLRRFYNHLAVYVILNLIITAFKMYDNLDSWESFKEELLSINVLSSWTVWGVVLLLHFISLKFGHTWEERKIDQYMKEELNKDLNKF